MALQAGAQLNHVISQYPAPHTPQPSQLLSSKQLMSRELYPKRPVHSLQFCGSSDQIAYVCDSVLYKGRAGKENAVLTLSQLNEVLTASGEQEVKTMPRVTFSNNSEFKMYAGAHLVLFNADKKSVIRLLDLSNSGENLDLEEHTNQFAYTKDNNLYVVNNGRAFAIEDENPDIVYGQSVHRNEFGISKGTFWSPRGTYLAFYRMDQSMVTDYPMVNTSTRIATPAPFKYPMAGMKSHEVTVGVYNSVTEKIIYLDTRKDTSVAEREMFLTNLTWSPDEKHVYIAKVNRQQNHMWLESYDAQTGKKERVLFEETSPKYTEPCEGLYFLPGKNNEFLWFSMRDGYKHLYHYKTDGTLLHQLTHGEYEVQGVIGFDTKGDNLFVYANKDNLAGLGAYRVNMKSGEMVPLTPAEGTHTVSISTGGSQLIDIWSSVQVPGRAVVRPIARKAPRTETQLTKNDVVIYSAENPLKDYSMPTFTLGTIKAADGKTDLYYRLITPPNLDSTKKYPTLVYVYGGPHSQLVMDSWLVSGNLYFTFLAQQGYVIFTVDNRGTDNRGFEFESCTHRHLGEIELADQLAGVKYLQSLPFVDQDRMGVEGWSFGGFMTITMKLTHPEIFKVGCAGGPVIDWKWYEVMYGERYMDMPQENPEGYSSNALTGKAGQLEGRLLVIHGAEDNTVVWQNSIEFVQACIKAGKQVDYMIYPHHEHNVMGYDRLHLYEKMFRYYEDFLK